jgi:hypothetical protein
MDGSRAAVCRVHADGETLHASGAMQHNRPCPVVSSRLLPLIGARGQAPLLLFILCRIRRTCQADMCSHAVPQMLGGKTRKTVRSVTHVRTWC